MADTSPNPPAPPNVTTLAPSTGLGILLLCAIALFILLIAIADPWGRTEAKVGTSGEPVVFVLSAAHAEKASAADLKALGAFLTKQTGLSVEVHAATGAVEGIDAFAGAGKADVGLLGLFEYVLARAEHGVEAEAQVLRQGGSTSFTGVIAVRADAPTRTLADLARAKVAFVTEYSTTGFVFPMKLFADEKVEVDVHLAGSHSAALDCLRNNTAAAVATYAEAVAGKPEFRVIATTSSIPNEPIFFRKGFEKGKRDRLCAALEYFSATDEGKALLPKFADIVGIRRVTDGHYQEITSVVAAAGKTIYDVVPGGVSIEARRRYLDLAPH